MWGPPEDNFWNSPYIRPELHSLPSFCAILSIDVKLQPHPALLFRTIGGILDIHMFLGPSPEQVTQQFTQVGSPTLPVLRVSGSARDFQTG